MPECTENSERITKYSGTRGRMLARADDQDEESAYKTRMYTRYIYTACKCVHKKAEAEAEGGDGGGS